MQTPLALPTNKHPRPGDLSLDQCELMPSKLVEFGHKWARTRPLHSLFLWGQYGSGKTTFAHALIDEAYRLGGVGYCRCITSTELDSKLLQSTKMDGGDAELVKNFCEEDLLFIDDMGRETNSDRLRHQYFQIIDYRWRNHFPTIVTSNMSLEQLADRLDGAVSSRMQSWHIIEFPKKDLRQNMRMSF